MDSNILEDVRIAIQKGETDMTNNPEFIRLKRFYEEMKNKGLIKKQSYNFPQLDTIGLRYFGQKKE